VANSLVVREAKNTCETATEELVSWLNDFKLTQEGFSDGLRERVSNFAKRQGQVRYDSGPHSCVRSSCSLAENSSVEPQDIAATHDFLVARVEHIDSQALQTQSGIDGLADHGSTFRKAVEAARDEMLSMADARAREFGQECDQAAGELVGKWETTLEKVAFAVVAFFLPESNTG
jgi:hypothetical protein